MNNSANSSHSKWKNGDYSEEDIQRSIKQNIENTIERLSLAGSVPVSINKFLENINKEKVIPWQQILRTKIGSLKVPYKRTNLRRNRRMPDRGDLLGRMSNVNLKLP
ncbi:hypothetical protein FPHOBKDP_00010 [Listeria phage LPJP1]|nr:hypothetical protein FPHOBKDP_00010 [Listeria phage LPJP1]